MQIAHQKGSAVVLWSVAGLAASLVFVLAQGILFNLYGYVSWTGVTSAAIAQILNIILLGTSIYSAVVAVVGVFLAGPIVAIITQIGITALKTWIKELGFSAVVGL